MARLNMIVEGDTEEAFVNNVLIYHLASFGVYMYPSRKVETSRRKVGHRRKGRQIFRGGMTNYAKAKGDILRWLKQDQQPDAFLTTMFDLYGLPADFPGFDDASQKSDPYERVEVLEQRLAGDIPDRRFIPHIQLHEFETLLFCDSSKIIAYYPGQDRAVARLQEVAANHDNPELIDDGESTSPSKRIVAEIPAYEGDKGRVGPQLAQDIGLAAIRSQCRHFDRWLKKLEELNTAATQETPNAI